jgi:hypothetical protein
MQALMVRLVSIAALALAGSACAAEQSRKYLVRLDLEEIVPGTAARAVAPGFESLRAGGGQALSIP